MTVEAVRAITYQDTKATVVTLGDHGWMHLTQDLRDAVVIAENKQDTPLSAKEKFILAMTAAYHDIGYAVPEVSDPQRASKGEYSSFDKGHLINSYVYIAGMRKRLQGVLGPEDTQALEQMIANHENPGLAKMAGKRTNLVESFAIADAGAAFGPDKLPAIISQIPEVLSYLNILTS